MTSFEISSHIDAKTLQRLSRISNVKSAWHLIFDWSVILMTAGVASSFITLNSITLLLYPVAVMLIANRQHSLLIAMHDSGHQRLFTNSIANDWIGELLCAWPIFVTMKAYRINHRLHHLYSNTPQDPDFRPERFPTHQKQILKMLITDVLGLNTLQQLREVKRFKTPSDQLSQPKRYKAFQILFYVSLATLLTYTSLWSVFLLYWVIPLFTWLKVILRLRAIADHAGVQENTYPFDTRTIIPTWFDRLFIAPRQCSYHFGHHLLQSVPSYHLKEFHHVLTQSPALKSRILTTLGFHNLIFEFQK